MMATEDQVIADSLRKVALDFGFDKIAESNAEEAYFIRYSRPGNAGDGSGTDLEFRYPTLQPDEWELEAFWTEGGILQHKQFFTLQELEDWLRARPI